MKLQLQTKDQTDKTPVFTGKEGGSFLLTPPIGEKYWAYKVALSEKQAIIGFPKFRTIGIGFQVGYYDWNTNLPYTCLAEEIYKHIIKNKGDKSIRKANCIKAIEMIQEAIAKDKASRNPG